MPAAAVRVIDEVVYDDAQFERGGMVWMDHPRMGRIPVPHSPIRWHGSPPIELEPSPDLGADNRSVLAELAGATEAELDALVAAGAIGPPAAGARAAVAAPTRWPAAPPGRALVPPGVPRCGDFGLVPWWTVAPGSASW